MGVGEKREGGRWKKGRRLKEKSGEDIRKDGVSERREGKRG